MHRLLMHRPLWPRTLYRNHTLGHHRAFHHDSMEIASWRELELVMMPWFSLLLFFAGHGAGRRRGGLGVRPRRRGPVPADRA